jgi:hypothetical protein
LQWIIAACMALMAAWVREKQLFRSQRVSVLGKRRVLHKSESSAVPIESRPLIDYEMRLEFFFLRRVNTAHEMFDFVDV